MRVSGLGRSSRRGAGRRIRHRRVARTKSADPTTLAEALRRADTSELIASEMAEEAVERLEAVEIEQEQGRRFHRYRASGGLANSSRSARRFGSAVSSSCCDLIAELLFGGDARLKELTIERCNRL